MEKAKNKSDKKLKKPSIDEAKVKQEAAAFVAKGHYKKALPLYVLLSEANTKDPRLKTKVADMLHKLGRTDEAIVIYRSIAAHYANDGLLPQAIALNKVILQLRPDDEGIQKELTALYSRRHGSEEIKTPLAKIKTVVRPIQIKEISITGAAPRTDLISPVQLPNQTVQIVVEREVENEEDTELEGRLVDFTSAVDLGAISEISLPPSPLFSDIDEKAFERVIQILKRREILAGEIVCEEGTPGDSIFLISEGEMTVSCRDSKGHPTELATLHAGDFFGEFGYFSDQRRHASVRARSECVALEMARSDLNLLCQSMPQVNEVLVSFYRKRLLATLLAKSRIFRPLSSEARELLSKKFQRQDFKPGDTVMQEGDEGDALYLIQEGQLDVTTKKDGRDVELASLREGDFCGEFSVFSGTKRTATVRAKTSAKLLRLSKQDALSVLTMHDDVPRILKEIYDERVAGTIKTLRQISTTLPDGEKARSGMV